VPLSILHAQVLFDQIQIFLLSGFCSNIDVDVSRPLCICEECPLSLIMSAARVSIRIFTVFFPFDKQVKKTLPSRPVRSRIVVCKRTTSTENFLFSSSIQKPAIQGSGHARCAPRISAGSRSATPYHTPVMLPWRQALTRAGYSMYSPASREVPCRSGANRGLRHTASWVFYRFPVFSEGQTVYCGQITSEAEVFSSSCSEFSFHRI